MNKSDGPTVCIRDIGRDSYSAIEVNQIISDTRSFAPGARLLIVSSRSEPREALDWIASGAHGYFLMRRADPALLSAATSFVGAGGIYIPEDLTRVLSAEDQRRKTRD